MRIDGKEMHFFIDGKRFHCALDVTMHFIGGKWKTVVLWYMRKEEKRFSELKRLIPDITEKMLSIQLKALVKDGFVSRKMFDEVPPKVVYNLTDRGRSLFPVLEEMAAWGRKFGESYLQKR